MLTDTEILQKINLVEGKFTASEARDVVCSLLDVKINFHKIQRLSVWEGDENADVVYPSARISELEQEKRKAIEFISQARKEGYSVKINGTLEITLD